MSRAFALVRFDHTGNIYFGSYNGTVDVMNPFLCTPQEVDESGLGPIYYCEGLSNNIGHWNFPDDILDLDKIEIYSGYGNGFYWPSQGSESIRMIKDNLMP